MADIPGMVLAPRLPSRPLNALATRLLRALVAGPLVLLLMLVGCGAGVGPDDESTAAGSSVAMPLAGAQSAPRRQALSAAGTIAPTGVSTDALLDWAELTWPALFPVGAQTQVWTVDTQTYHLRQYAGGNLVGVDAAGVVWGRGPFTGDVLTNYGHQDEFFCLVNPTRCAPSGGAATRCETGISTGFAGDLNAVYEVAGGGSGAGSSGGDDGGGSAGIGGSEGKVLGARFRAYRLADGALLAQGLTDRSQGLATLRWCAADLPLMLELQGAPGATYYDEALERMVEFPLTQKLRALVDRFDENVGVSALTEAAYLYAMNHLHGNPSPVADGLVPLVSEGVPLGLSAAQVRQANQRVLDEVNNRLADPLQQTSMKALATPVDQTSALSVLPRNRYGRIAALTGGFAKLARGYNGNSATPALSFARQFAQDMSDGRLDQFSITGQAVAAVGERSYKATSASLDFTLGQGAMGARFGQGTTQLDGEPYVDFQTLWLGFSPETCRSGWGETAIGYYYLSTVGTVTRVLTEAPAGGCVWQAGNRRSTELNHLRGIRKLVAGHGERMFAITHDGDLYGWGWALCGRIGNGVLADTLITQPVKIAGIGRVVDLVMAGGVNLALTADGEVWSWGVELNGVVSGHGPSESWPTCVDRLQSPPPNYPNARPIIAAPRKVQGLTDIVTISANVGWGSVVAVDSQGQRWEWGQVPDGLGASTFIDRPRRVQMTHPVLKISASPSMFFGIARGGHVLSWWLQGEEIFAGQRVADLSQPRFLDGVNDVVDIVSDAIGGNLALRADGSVMTWGRWRRMQGDVTLTPRLATGFAVNNPRAASGQSKLPRIVRLTVLAGYAAAIGADGLAYRLLPGSSEAEFRWEVNVLFADLPSPY